MTREAGTEADGCAAARGDTRRAVLVGAGLVAAAGAAAACGGGGDDGASGGRAEDGVSGGGGGVLAQIGEVPVGGGKIFKDQGVVVTQPAQGEFKAFDITCPHRGCPVDSVEGGAIVCPCHRSMFSIADGSPQGGPAKRPLAAKRIVVEGTSIKLA